MTIELIEQPTKGNSWHGINFEHMREISVRTRRGTSDRILEVCISGPGASSWVYMTADQARELADALNNAAHVAETSHA